jgi:hypothetical protein
MMRETMPATQIQKPNMGAKKPMNGNSAVVATGSAIVKSACQNGIL